LEPKLSLSNTIVQSGEKPSKPLTNKPEKSPEVAPRPIRLNKKRFSSFQLERQLKF